jgi:hypothetical protein
LGLAPGNFGAPHDGIFWDSGLQPQFKDFSQSADLQAMDDTITNVLIVDGDPATHRMNRNWSPHQL